MLRSKFHRPWQPQVSDSQPFNPFVQGGEAEGSLSEQIIETPEETHAAARAAQDRPPAAEEESSGTDQRVSTQVTPQRQRWYESLFGRFVRH